MPLTIELDDRTAAVVCVCAMAGVAKVAAANNAAKTRTRMVCAPIMLFLTLVLDSPR